jgi:molybdate transport system substrate-binding protein
LLRHYRSRTFGRKLFFEDNMKKITVTQLFCAVATMLALANAPRASANEIVLVSAGTLTAVMKTLGPAFESQHPYKLSTRFVLSPILKQEIDKGAPFDVVIGTPDQLAALIKEDKVVAASLVDLGRTGVGIVVRAGAAKPDISTVDLFRAAMLKTESITYAKGATGAHLERVFERLGIAEQMRAKSKFQPVAGAFAQAVAKGEAEIGIGVVSNIIAEPGVTFAGTLPEELQNYLASAAGVSAKATNAAGANAFVQFLAMPATTAILKANGISAAPR